jgi:phospholipid/cholesterol/gamma-HCH transport system substrate-binding protein
MLSALFKSAEFKVGLLVLVISGIVATMSLKVSQDPSYLGSTKEAWFMMDDASGIVKNSAVKMAGIDVGIIKDIKLERGQARVYLIVKGDTPITKSARIEIRPNGILGDKHVEIISGEPRDPPLRSGEQILVVDDRASVDRLIGEVSKITKSLSAVTDNIKAATEGDTDKPLGRILDNIEKLTGDLAELTSERKSEVGEIIENIHGITSTVDDLVNDESSEGFKAAWKDALHSLKRIDKSLRNVEDITDKVNKGEGTIGKLINDETTVDNINSAIEGFSGLLDTAAKLQTGFDFHADYLSSTAQSKATIELIVQPGLDRYYQLGVVSDPIGYTTSRQSVTTTNGGPAVTVNEKDTSYNKLKFNAMYAKNFYNWTLKGGVIETTGGAAVDYYALRRKLRFSFEAFDLVNFHLRASARYNIWNGIYLTGGGDDLANAQGVRQAYAGAGLYLTNDDLKLFLSKIPF